MMISSSSSARGEGQLAHSQIVDDEQGHGHQELHVLFVGAVERGLGQLIEQAVGLAVEHAVPLLDSGVADGLSQVALAGAGRTEKQCVFAAHTYFAFLTMDGVAERADMQSSSTGPPQQLRGAQGRPLGAVLGLDAIPYPRFWRRCSRSSCPVWGSSRRTYRSSHCTRTWRPIQPGGAP